MKAGGHIHGEPAIRNPETGYYSAAVLDFDNNSIEVMYREKKSAPARSTVSSWQQDVARHSAGRSIVSNSPQDIAKNSTERTSEVAKSPPRITVNNYTTTPALLVTQPAPETKPKHEMSSRAIIGTLLGAAAGAAVAYAMTRAEEEDIKAAEPRNLTYRAIEAPRSEVAQSEKGSKQAYSQTVVSQAPRSVVQQIEYPEPPASIAGRSSSSNHSVSGVPTLGPRTLTSPALGPRSALMDNASEASWHPPGSLVRSHTDSQVKLFSRKAPSNISQHPESSAKSSTSKTITPSDFKSAKGSVVTEVRVARDLPLPESRKGSVVTEMRLARDLPLPESRNGSVVTEVRTARDLPLPDSRATSVLDLGSVAGSVTPSDSVSQAGSKKSRPSGRTKRHSSSKLRESKTYEDGDSRVSERRTVSHGDHHAEDKRPTSKGSVQRTVMSFLGA